ncbi:ATP-binding protein [Clostridium tyrobutyricum]|uniref:ATP-binding protein n=1 Tax=Clostridium tyrobutyricum TaxID=1519 RepID=UPI00037CD6CD|nr:ATP-binding protein [Clostridium tyrobutyricum]
MLETQNNLQNMESTAPALVSTSKSKLKNCPVCGEPTGKIIRMLGRNYIVPRMCKCRRKALDENKRISDARNKQIRLKQMFNNSLMTKEFQEFTFENWDHTLGNEKMYDLGIKYVKSFKEKALKENIGLLIYGNPGNGKTYLSGCIANALMSQYVPVVCVSAIGLLDRIKSSFGKYGDEGIQSILSCLDNADLVIIDDMGVENNTEWSRATMYQILDSRYRKKKPLMVTSNLTKSQLKKRYDKDCNSDIGRTADRLMHEMCSPIENTSPSIRIKKGMEKTKILGEILNN